MTTYIFGGYTFKYNLGSGIAVYEPEKTNSNLILSAPKELTHRAYEKECENFVMNEVI